MIKFASIFSLKRFRPVLALLPMLLLVVATAASAASGDGWRGLTVAEALDRLAELGVRVVYTDRLVTDDLRVTVEPRHDESASQEPALLLDELLRPHGLAAEPTVGGRFLVVRASVPRVIRGRVVSALDGGPLAGAVLLGKDGQVGPEIDAEGRFEVPEGSGPWRIALAGFETVPLPSHATDADDALEVALRPVSVDGEMVEVRAARPWILGESLSTLTLRKEDLLALPHVGDDVFRSLSILPGASSTDASARLSVRGGREDELLVLLDGVEIFEPYHLKDFNSFLSILSPQIIDSVELRTGGFSAELGDRLSGTLLLGTVEPESGRRVELGLGPLDLRGTFAKGGPKHSLLVSLRAGSLEIPFRFADVEERPVFADAFVKIGHDPRPELSRRAAGLFSYDQLRFAQVEDEREEQFRTAYRNAYAWVSELRLRSDALFVTSRLTGTVISRSRSGSDTLSGGAFELRDERWLTTFGVDQDWHWSLSDRHRLKWGVDLRRLEASYDYVYRLGERGPLASIRSRLPQDTELMEDFRGRQPALYVSHQARFGPSWTMEAGLRFDRNTVLGDNYTVHPRFNLDYRSGPRTRWSASWGKFNQSQRLYELQVEDGVERFFPMEKAVYSSLGVETTLPGNGVVYHRRPPTLRVELYRRQVRNPRPRFENLFDPISKVPELEPDRYEFAPQKTLAQGFEIFLGGAVARTLDGFASYTYADTYDRIDGADVRPLSFQRHSLRLDLTWHTPWSWDVQVAWNARSGRPTTALTAGLETLDGETRIAPVLGPINAERLPAYRRLDLRASRSWQRPSGSELELYILVQNLLRRRNTRGYDFEFEARDDGTVDVLRRPETWGGSIPSFGVQWRF